MSFLEKANRVDLQNLAVELGENIDRDLKTSDIRKIILNTQIYEEDVEFVIILLDTLTSERKEDEQKKRNQLDNEFNRHQLNEQLKRHQLEEQWKRDHLEKQHELDKFRLNVEVQKMSAYASMQGDLSSIKLDLGPILQSFNPETNDSKQIDSSSFSADKHPDYNKNWIREKAVVSSLIKKPSGDSHISGNISQLSKEKKSDYLKEENHLCSDYPSHQCSIGTDGNTEPNTEVLGKGNVVSACHGRKDLETNGRANALLRKYVFQPGGGAKTLVESYINAAEHHPITDTTYRLFHTQKNLVTQEQVMTSMCHLRENEGKCAKFIPRRDGPYVILSQKSPTSFETANLKDPSIPLGVYHSSALKLFSLNPRVIPMRPLRKRGRLRKNLLIPRRVAVGIRGGECNGCFPPVLGGRSKAAVAFYD